MSAAVGCRGLVAMQGALSAFRARAGISLSDTPRSPRVFGYAYRFTEASYDFDDLFFGTIPSRTGTNTHGLSDLPEPLGATTGN